MKDFPYSTTLPTEIVDAVYNGIVFKANAAREDHADKSTTVGFEDPGDMAQFKKSVACYVADDALFEGASGVNVSLPWGDFYVTAEYRIFSGHQVV